MWFNATNEWQLSPREGWLNSRLTSNTSKRTLVRIPNMPEQSTTAPSPPSSPLKRQRTPRIVSRSVCVNYNGAKKDVLRLFLFVFYFYLFACLQRCCCCCCCPHKLFSINLMGIMKTIQPHQMCAIILFWARRKQNQIVHKWNWALGAMKS